MRRRIVILVAEGFTDSGLSIALDVFRAANALAKRTGADEPFRVDVASARGGRVQAASGMSLDATRAASRMGRADVVLLPGLWVESAADIDRALARDDVAALVAAAQRAHAQGAIVGASCTGAFLLAEAGLLEGRRCTTAWWLAAHLRARCPGARVDADCALVLEGSIASAGAVFAQADLALHLVAHFAGPALADQCARVLLLDTHPSQAAYMAMQVLSANDATVRRAEAWVRKHLAEDFAVGKLARHVGMSARTLARRLEQAVGLSPIEFVRRIRAEVATRLLATTSLSLEEVGRRVGYTDASTLRRLLREETGRSPREIRGRISPPKRASRRPSDRSRPAARSAGARRA